MCVIIRQKMKLYWIIGLLVLWAGIISTDNVTAAPGASTTTTTFIISIKITNRIYNDSLKDHQSQSYKILRQDVEKMFFEIYSSTPSVQYQDIAEMTFSNGSVIANSKVIFGSTLKSGQTVKDIFVTNYKQHSSLPLDLNISYTEDQEPIHFPFPFLLNILPSTTSVSESSPSHNIYTSSELLEHVQAGDKTFTSSTTSTTSTNGSGSPDHSINVSPKMYSTTNGNSPTTSTSQTTSNSTPDNSSVSVTSSNLSSPMSASSLSNHSNSTVLTTYSSSPVSITQHPSSKTSTVSVSKPLITTSLSNKTSSISGSGPLNTTTRPSSNNSAMPASSSSVSPGKTATQNSTGSDGSDAVATNQGVPSWGIAILVLAAIILFFMLVLLILLLLFWCCWWKQRGFMNVSDPDPTGYYNPDIPMYSTHSTYDSHNGKSLVADSERPS